MQRFKLHAEGAAKTKHTHCALKSYCTPVVLHSEMMGCLVAVSHRHHQLVVHVTDMVFVSSVCTPHALALGMVFSNVSHCVARSHSIIYDPPPNPPALTQQVSQYVVYTSAFCEQTQGNELSAFHCSHFICLTLLSGAPLSNSLFPL